MEPKTIQANGLEFAYLEMGEGPLALCVHGFPDTAHTWLPTLELLAEAGYRAVAPFTRGIYPTQIPADGDYSSKQLGLDVLALIDAFGAEQAILIGHDWGALACYFAANHSPEKVSKLITVAIPHSRVIKFNLKTLRKAWHFIGFQIRPVFVPWMKRANFAFVEYIWRHWSPNGKFTDSDFAPIKDAYGQPGRVEAALGYYWSFISKGKEARPVLGKKTSVPTLTFAGDSDGAIDVSFFEKSHKAFTGPYELVILPGAGHFLHREKPEEFHRKVLDYLERP